MRNLIIGNLLTRITRMERIPGRDKLARIIRGIRRIRLIRVLWTPGILCILCVLYVGVYPVFNGTVNTSSLYAQQSVDSEPFNITPAAANNLEFVQQPLSTTAGTIITSTGGAPVTVRCRDQYNNLVPNVSVSVTTTNGALMSGTLITQSNTSGIATFNNLSISVAGDNYALSATALVGEITISTTSNAFNITPDVTIPTVTTQAVTDYASTTATGNGTITNLGGAANCTERGFTYGLDTNANTTTATDTGTFGTGAYTRTITTGLSPGTTYYIKAYAKNSAGYGYDSSYVSFTTTPAAPTGVAATDGTYTDRVTITWTKSTGATGYQVYRDSTALGWLGDVATYDDTGANAPTITPGSAAASDGTSADYVSLSLSGQSANNGTTYTYKVMARNATDESADSATDTGYRSVGTLTYQWQRSDADSDATYSDISGATTAPYNQTVS